MSAEPKRFKMNIMDISYFSGKLECFFRYKQIDYERNEASWQQLLDDIYPNTGTMQVPTVHDRKTNKWLRDTSSIMHYIENDDEIKQSPGHKSTIPGDKNNKIQQFICYLLEDFFDEYLWRDALYYRWNDDIDANHLAQRFIKDFMDAGLAKYIPKLLQIKLIKYRQRTTYLYNDGIKGNEQKQFIEAQYMEILKLLDQIFEDRPFLFGDTPTFADFGLFSSMFRHFSLDPTPRKLMLLNASNVYEWVARMWNAKMSKMNISKTEYKMDVLYPLLKYYVHNYLKYLYLNEKAFIDKQNNFDLEIGIQGIDKCVLKELYVVPFRVWCRLRLQRKYKELDFDEDESKEIEEILRGNNCWEYLWKGTGGDTSKDEKIQELDELPLCKKAENDGVFQYFMLSLNGSPKWDDKFATQLLTSSVFVLIAVFVVLVVLYYML